MLAACRRPLAFPVDGFAPLQAPPSPQALRACRFLAASLRRLADAARPRGGASAAAIGPADAVLLASVLCERLAPCCMEQYLVSSEVLPELQEAAIQQGAGPEGAGAQGGLLPGVLRLLGACLAPEVLSSLAELLGQVRVHTVQRRPPCPAVPTRQLRPPTAPAWSWQGVCAGSQAPGDLHALGPFDEDDLFFGLPMVADRAQFPLMTAPERVSADFETVSLSLEALSLPLA